MRKRLGATGADGAAAARFAAADRAVAPDGAQADTPQRGRRARHPCEQREPLARVSFSRESLPQVRRLAGAAAERARLGRTRREELVLAVDELATNSVVHGGGRGELQMWPTTDGIVCEVRDSGHISDPLVGARAPRPGQLGGRGLWVAGQLCDHLEIASSPGRTVVRVHMRRR